MCCAHCRQGLEALLASGGSVPINVKVMLEGEEEVGSPFLEPFLAKHAGLLAADFVLSADGGQIAADQPAALLGLRSVLSVLCCAVVSCAVTAAVLPGSGSQRMTGGAAYTTTLVVYLPAAGFAS